MNWKPNTIANKTLWGNSIQQFAKGHLEQLGHAVCALTIEGTAYDFQFDGLGLRDPNWGPRYWQAPKYHRWLTLNFDEGLGAMASITVNRDGSEHSGGFLVRKGQPTVTISKVDIETEFTGEQQLHDFLKLTCTTEHDGAPIVITGTVRSMIPLRYRRAGIVTRIAEGMTERRWSQGRLWPWRESRPSSGIVID
jgi:hypothetical protein